MIEKANTSPLLGYLIIMAALVPIAAILGYGLVYLYELRYCNVFGIPNDFIVISWTTILADASRMFFALLIVPFVLMVLSRYISNVEPMKPIRRIFIRYIVTFIMFMAVVILFPSYLQQGFIIVLSFTVLFLLVGLLSPLWTQREVEGYRNKLIAQREYEIFQSNIGSDPVERYLGKYGNAMVFVTLIVFIAAFFGGTHDATTQKEFLVPSTDEQLVVLRIYGDNLICAPLDIEQKCIEERFYILEITNTILTPQIVGPLTVSPDIQD